MDPVKVLIVPEDLTSSELRDRILASFTQAGKTVIVVDVNGLPQGKKLPDASQIPPLPQVYPKVKIDLEAYQIEPWGRKLDPWRRKHRKSKKRKK